ncbi:MAG: hypothetical protein ABIG63_21625 [Chloroflexota bacterium]
MMDWHNPDDIAKWLGEVDLPSLELECPECGAPDIAVAELQADRSQQAYCKDCGLLAQVEEFEK